MRRVVSLKEPFQDAWVYLFNRDIAKAAVVESGNWAEYVVRRGEQTGGGS